MLAKIESKYPEIVVDLSETDGNLFAILSAMRIAMRAGKVSAAEISAFFDDAIGLDLVPLLDACCHWVTVAPMQESESQAA